MSKEKQHLPLPQHDPQQQPGLLGEQDEIQRSELPQEFALVTDSSAPPQKEEPGADAEKEEDPEQEIEQEAGTELVGDGELPGEEGETNEDGDAEEGGGPETPPNAGEKEAPVSSSEKQDEIAPQSSLDPFQPKLEASLETASEFGNLPLYERPGAFADFALNFRESLSSEAIELQQAFEKQPEMPLRAPEPFQPPAQEVQPFVAPALEGVPSAKKNMAHNPVRGAQSEMVVTNFFDPSVAKSVNQDVQAHLSQERKAIGQGIKAGPGDSHFGLLKPDLPLPYNPLQPEVPAWDFGGKFSRELDAERGKKLEPQLVAHFQPDFLAGEKEAENAYQTLEKGIEDQGKLGKTNWEGETSRFKTEQEKEAEAGKSKINEAGSKWDEGLDLQKFELKSLELEKNLHANAEKEVLEGRDEYWRYEREGQKKVKDLRRNTEKKESGKKEELEKAREDLSIWEAIYDTFAEFAAYISDAISSLWEDFKTYLGDIWQEVEANISALFPKVREAIQIVVESYRKELEALTGMSLEEMKLAASLFMENARKIIATVNEGLQKLGEAFVEGLGKVAQSIVESYEFYHQAYRKTCEEIARAWEAAVEKMFEILENLDLIGEALWLTPEALPGALYDEVIGIDLSAPLPGIERSEKEEARFQTLRAEQESSAPTPENADTEPAPPLELAEKPRFSDQDIVTESGPETLPEGFSEKAAALEPGQEMELLGADDPVSTEDVKAEVLGVSKDSVNSGEEPEPTGADAPNPNWAAMSDPEKLDHHLHTVNPDPAQADTKAKKGEVENKGPEAETYQELVQKTGPLGMGQRGFFLVRQMLNRLSNWWKDNKTWVLTAGAATLAGAGIIGIITGGAGLLAVAGILVQALSAYFLASTLIEITALFREFVQKSIDKDVKGGSKSLATALAKIFNEFILQYILAGLGKWIKIKKNKLAKTSGGKEGLLSKVKRNLTENKAAKAMGGMYRRGKQIVMGGFKKGWASGVKTLGGLRKRVLKIFGFRRIWLVRNGKWVELWGSFNSKAILLRWIAGAKDKGHYEYKGFAQVDEQARKNVRGQLDNKEEIGKEITDQEWKKKHELGENDKAVVVSEGYEERWNNYDKREKQGSTKKVKERAKKDKKAAIENLSTQADSPKVKELVEKNGGDAEEIAYQIRREEGQTFSHPPFDPKASTLDGHPKDLPEIDPKREAEGMDDLLDERQQSMQEYQDLKNEPNPGPDLEEKLEKSLNKTRRTSEKIGLAASDDYMVKQHGAEIIYQGTGGGYQYDRIYKKGDTLYVVEAKGGKSPLGGKYNLEKDRYVQQGTSEYLEVTNDQLNKNPKGDWNAGEAIPSDHSELNRLRNSEPDPNGKIGDLVEKANKEGKLRYILIQQTISEDGKKLSELIVKEFDHKN